jgi:hypothetical protein
VIAAEILAAAAITAPPMLAAREGGEARPVAPRSARLGLLWEPRACLGSLPSAAEHRAGAAFRRRRVAAPGRRKGAVLLRVYWSAVGIFLGSNTLGALVSNPSFLGWTPFFKDCVFSVKTDSFCLFLVLHSFRLCLPRGTAALVSSNPIHPSMVQLGLSFFVLGAQERHCFAQ